VPEVPGCGPHLQVGRARPCLQFLQAAEDHMRSFRPREETQVVAEDGSDAESPRKRPRAEMPSGKRPAVVIETAAGKRLLRELLACNSRSAWAAERRAAAVEEQAGALLQIARGFGLLSAVLSQQEYQPWDGADEQGEREGGTEKEKGKTKEVQTDGES
jgi:hypothetical protein